GQRRVAGAQGHFNLVRSLGRAALLEDDKLALAGFELNRLAADLVAVDAANHFRIVIATNGSDGGANLYLALDWDQLPRQLDVGNRQVLRLLDADVHEHGVDTRRRHPI